MVPDYKSSQMRAQLDELKYRPTRAKWDCGTR